MIINLTNHERWKLNAAYSNGGTLDFYDKRDLYMRQGLIERGIIESAHPAPGIHQARLTPLGREALNYLKSKKAEEDRIWGALLKEVKRIDTDRETYGGTSREIGEYTHYEDGGILGTCRYSAGNKDGTRTIYQISGLLQDGQIVLEVTQAEDSSDSFWGPGGPRDQDDPARRVVVDHEHYVIAPEGDDPHGFRGFGGRRWEIEFFDGRRVTSTNLWYQGVVPPKWRERFPNNARFVPPPPPKSIAEQLGLTTS